MYKKILILMMAVLIVVFSFSGCSKKSAATSPAATGSSYNGMKENGEVAKDGAMADTAANQSAEKPTSQASSANGNGGNVIDVGAIADGGHKVIYTGDIVVETLNFDKTVGDITRYVDVAGGYAEMSNIQGGRSYYTGEKSRRTASFTFRIPKNSFSKFMTDVKNTGNVVSENTKGEDISDKYFDTETRVTTLKVQEDRILNLLKKAENMEDIIKLEAELSNIRYQIESLTGTLRKWDNLVDFSTVNVTVNEVEEIKPVVTKPQTLLDRISKGFKDSISALADILEGFIVVIVVILPFAVVLGILGYIAWRVFRWKHKKNSPARIEEKKEE